MANWPSATKISRRRVLLEPALEDQSSLGRPGCRPPGSVYDEAMKARIYVDASVVGGCEDAEFSEHSVRLMERFRRGDLVLVISTLTVQELAAAPDEVRRHLAAVPEACIETLQLDAEAGELAEAYIAEGVISAKMRADAQHIVNLYRIHGYNSVNLRRGYPTLEIRAPREVLPDE